MNYQLPKWLEEGKTCNEETAMTIDKDGMHHGPGFLGPYSCYPVGEMKLTREFATDGVHNDIYWGRTHYKLNGKMHCKYGVNTWTPTAPFSIWVYKGNLYVETINTNIKVEPAPSWDQ